MAQGLNFDDITQPHRWTFGTPNAQTIPKNSILSMKTTNVFSFDLSQFPLNKTPSGGMSGVLSSGEMVAVLLHVDDIPSPSEDQAMFTWFKDGKKLRTISTADLTEDDEWETYYVDYFSTFGRFTGELTEPGNCSVYIQTPWGNAQIDFEVYDSGAATPKPEPSDPTTCPRGAAYVASGWEAIFGCSEPGYTRPLWGDNCVCQSTPVETDVPVTDSLSGLVANLPLIIGALIFTQLLGAFGRR